jgi:hypothetical protein
MDHHKFVHYFDYLSLLIHPTKSNGINLVKWVGVLSQPESFCKIDPFKP